MGEAKRLDYFVPCRKCGKGTTKKLAELAHNSAGSIPCDCCGAIIDLQSGNIAVDIQATLQKCADLDRLLGKAD